MIRVVLVPRLRLFRLIRLGIRDPVFQDKDLALKPSKPQSSHLVKSGAHCWPAVLYVLSLLRRRYEYERVNFDR